MATLSSPLYTLLHHDSNYEFTDDHKKAFDSIKKALTSSTFLGYPVDDGKAQFIIQTDASTTAMDMILYQESGEDKWVITYNSHILTSAQTQYSTTKNKFMLASNKPYPTNLLLTNHLEQRAKGPGPRLQQAQEDLSRDPA
uniref:Reverse transcriptase/retrotransposon-derived protein RNase H-like domain-containing protein n=1 Tax=Romanomermis culicivorax TaxID=13658 RepID=A0A915KQG2_ROMCU